MNSVIYMVAGSLLVAGIEAGEKRSVGETGECSCVERFFMHYYFKKCTPVFEEGCDCPVRFDCPVYERDREGCQDIGKFYHIGETIDDRNPCTECECEKLFKMGSRTTCTTIHCAFALSANQFAAGCYPVFDKDKCCPTEYACEDEDPLCYQDGNLYRRGERIKIKDDPCTICYCDDDWHGMGSDHSNCLTMSCLLDMHGKSIENGCLPVYSKKGCCPLSFYCETGKEELIPAETNEIEPDPKMQCVFGNIIGNIGDTLVPFNKYATCSCITPPDFTCFSI